VRVIDIQCRACLELVACVDLDAEGAMSGNEYMIGIECPTCGVLNMLERDALNAKFQEQRLIDATCN